MTIPTIEPMTAKDWEEVRAIYAEGIATGIATFETEPPSWEAWNGAHIPGLRFVARGGRQVVGWAALSPVSERCVYAGVGEVSVYVGARHRGAGTGRLLLERLVAESESHGLWTLRGAWRDIVLLERRSAIVGVADSLPPHREER